MGPEVWVTIAAVFVAGGAIGSAGTLLAQWLLSRVDPGPPPARGLDGAERTVLHEELAELHRHLRNLDARLDFTERLLDGALPLAPPPTRLPAPDIPSRLQTSETDQGEVRET
ncbi:MAG: hypothetical protein OEN56_01840 [Gemmatimonadota bacterium]|nr:hypothetical protein [Gemmatimonadota bacterium]